MFARVSLVALFAASFAGGVWFDRATVPKRTEVAFLAVGQGDATLLRDGGLSVLIDTGRRDEDFDAGERLLAPQLRAMGVRKIDCLVLTHPDLDHVGGLRTLSERVRIGRVVVSRLFRNDPEMLKALGESRISPSQVVWIDGVWRASVGRFDLVIAAPGGHAGTEPNEGSLFVRADVVGASLLVTGDANSDTEAAMSGVYDWDVDVLKAGHHGSRFSTSTEWLEATSPSLVVASCGRGNMYGHPAPAMVDRVRAYGARFMRTDRDGTIVLLPDGDDWRVLPFGALD